MTAPIYDATRRSSLGRRLRPVAVKVRPHLIRVVRMGAPGPYRKLARAQLASSDGAWTDAADDWRATIDAFSQPRPIWYYELSVALANLGRIDEAATQRGCSLTCQSTNQFDFHRLAGRAAADEDWGLAAQAFRRAATIDGTIDTLELAADAFYQHGEMSEAVETYEQIIERDATAPPTSFAGLANALRKLGELDRAEQVSLRGLALHPDSPDLHSARAWLATERRGWSEASHRWPLAFATRRSRTPPRWFFRYGEALEQLGRHREAVELYDHALRSLEDVDEPWAHWAILEWEFRRAYCDGRIGGGAPEKPTLAVEVAPGGRSDSASTPSSRTTGGSWFSADVSHLGVRLRGWLDDSSIASVEVLVDGQPVKTVDVDRTGSKGQFAFTIRHSALCRFPRTGTVTVSTGIGELVADTCGSAVTVEVPHGDGTLLERLESGEVFTKKGALVPADAADLSPEQLLSAYTTIRRLFSDRFGIDLFLLYGTLLGCHRDGRFIPGDDDLDVGYLTTCTDPEQMKREAITTMQAVIDAGFDVTTRHGGGLFKVWLGEVDIDVYPIWFSGGRAWGYDAVVATADDYAPAKPRDLLGVEVLVPANPQVLLAGTYGAGWTEPNPGFRHYRSKGVLNMLQRTCLTPTEAKHMLEDNERRRAQQPSMGTFEMHNGGAR